MKLERINHKDRDEVEFRLTITDLEMVKMKLHPFDRALIADCDSSDTISDKLLALETIARRIEEASR